jgi:cytochrome b
LLALLLTQASTGLFANDEIDNTGPFFGWVSEHWSNRLSGYHRRIFDLIKIAVALHLLAVGYYAWGRGENLVRPMITGRKSASRVPVQAQIGGSRIRLALAIVLLLAAVLALAVHLAPDASLSVF